MASITHRLATGQLGYDFIGKRRQWYLVSGIIVAICIGALIIRGLSLGIEFSGGTDFQAPMTIQGDTIATVRQELVNSPVAELDAQVFAVGDDTLRVQTRSLNPDETTQVRALVADLAGVSPQDVTYTAIGPSWGQQVSQQALVALVVFIGLVMILIAVWFRDWRMSLAAAIHLAHVLIITIGVYALVGFSVTPATMIGMLTILGYSLYDTVVVFDQIRRNTREVERSNKTYAQLVNRAINQVLIRSINTTIIGVLPVSALVFAGVWLGGGPLGDLGLALLVGMIAGAYSSIFLAAALVVEFNSRLERYRAHDAKVEAARSKQVESTDDATDSAEQNAESPLETVGAVSEGTRRQPGPKLSRAERKHRNARR